MEDSSKKENQISRRGILPILGSVLLIPFLGLANPINNEIVKTDEDENYQTLLKADGTTVKVKMSVLKKAKVVKKTLSNKSFLNWLQKKSDFI